VLLQSIRFGIKVGAAASASKVGTITLPSHTKSDVSTIFVSDSGAPHIKMSYSVNPRQSMSRLPTMQGYLTKAWHVVKSWYRKQMMNWRSQALWTSKPIPFPSVPGLFLSVSSSHRLC